MKIIFDVFRLLIFSSKLRMILQYSIFFFYGIVIVNFEIVSNIKLYLFKFCKKIFVFKMLKILLIEMNNN